MVAVIGLEVLLVAMKEGMAPVPLAAKPIFVLSFVQLKLVPDSELVAFKEPTVLPAQTTISLLTLRSGTGLISTFCEVVVVPHSLVTVNEIFCGPTEAYVIDPGFKELDEAGLPPPNIHA